jgi:UPF0716 family protein affecting phage T7 exclusion
MEGFITFVFAFIIIVWVVARLTPLFLAWWLRRKFTNLTSNRQQQYNETYKGKEGDVTIESDRKEQKIVDKSVGEYVDFEETNQK